MQVRRDLGFTVLFLVCLHACAGGSGSSGFDVTSENAAIQQALTEQQCVKRQGLTICPAGPTAPGNLPTSTPSASPSPSLVATAQPTPTRSSIATPTLRGTAPPTPTPTPTAVVSAPRVDTALDGATSVACVQTDATAPCDFILPFAPLGFPASAVFRVAVRLDTSGSWSIGPALTATGPANGASVDAPVAVAIPSRQTPGAVTVQLAVLVFLDPSTAVPEQVQELGDSGASFAFVTAELGIEAQTIAPGFTEPGAVLIRP